MRGCVAGAVEMNANPGAMVSALLMFRRVALALRYASREEEFLPMFSAGAVLLLIGHPSR
jgi:hypothetical protein